MSKRLDDAEGHLLMANLVALRERAGLTQAQAADVSGVPLDNLRRYESGKSGIDAITLRQLATAYGRPTDHFFMKDPPDVSAESVPTFFLRTRPGVDVDSELYDALRKKVDEANRTAADLRRKKPRTRT